MQKAKKIKILGWENDLNIFFRASEELLMPISKIRVATIKLYVNETFVTCSQLQTHKTLKDPNIAYGSGIKFVSFTAIILIT